MLRSNRRKLQTIIPSDRRKLQAIIRNGCLQNPQANPHFGLFFTSFYVYFLSSPELAFLW